MQNVANAIAASVNIKRDASVVGKRDVISSFAFVEAIYLIFLSQQAEALGLFFDSFVRSFASQTFLMVCVCVCVNFY